MEVVINMLQQEKPVMSDVMLDYLVSLNKLLDWLEGKILGWEETWDLRAKSCRIMAMLARNLKEAKKSEDQMCARFLVHHFLQWCFNTNLYKHGTDSIVSRVRRDDELNGQDKLEQSLSDCLQRLMESLTDSE